MSSLLWVPVPAGQVRNGKAVLRVVITPRLDDTLEKSGMAGWPAAINDNPALQVQTRPAGSLAPDGDDVHATLQPLARPDVWQRFFGAIGVTPWSQPAGYDNPDVRPTSDHAKAITSTYKTMAAAAISDPGSVRTGLQQWHQPETAPAAIRSPASPPCNPPDFHRAVALLREHPLVLRLLGLIIELELDGLPQSDSTREISVTWPGSPVPVEQRWTSYEFDGTHFLPASDGDIVSGLVDLSVPDRWHVITFDVDGGVGKLRETARAVLSDGDQAGGNQASGDQADPLSDASQQRIPLPTLKSAGLMLARAGRAEQLQARSQRGRAAASAAQDRVLTAEDLVLGYRIDVRPQESNTWFSLHRRNANYRFGDLPAVEAADEEGHLKAHAIVQDEDGLHADEVVARWDGWSLSVARPSLDGRVRASRRSQSCPLPYDFEVTYQVMQASLPELEFGTAYQLRARVADIAGGGLLRDDPAANRRATDLETYVRYEAVPPPQVTVPDGLLVQDEHDPEAYHVNNAVLGPGGSLGRLVIRSSPVPGGGFSTAEFGTSPAYPANDSREIFAPATTFAIAEQHGKLRLADETGWARVSRAFASGRAGTPDVPVSPSAQLPDPAALGAAAALLPEQGMLASVVHDDRPWGGTWPDLATKHIGLVPGQPGTRPVLRWVAADPGGAGPAAAPEDSADSPLVRVELAPGDHVIVELSSTIRADNIDSFAINRMVGVPDPDAAPTAVQNAVVQGRHPMLTPPRQLELVHAVRRPLQAPAGAASADRPPGATYARILPAGDPLWHVHTPTTAQVDVQATWQEWTDAPAPSDTSVPVPSLAVSRGAASLPELQQEFGDTKHRIVTYGLTAVSRYRDCFAPTDPDDGFRVAGQLAPVSIPSSARPAPPVIVATVPAFAWSDTTGAGALTRVRSGGRLRIELGRPWFTTGAGEAVGVVLWPGQEAGIPEELTSQVSWLNRDPIHPTPAPPALAVESMFASAAGPADVHLPDSDIVVRVLPYPVFFNDGRWYADIEMPGAASASYSPFVHLAVARYQQDSVTQLSPPTDLRMSTVVRTDMVPVLPDRQLDVRQADGKLQITLSGLSRQGPNPNRVIASIERSDAPSTTTAPVELTSLTLSPPGFPAWTRVAGATVTGTTNQALPALAIPADPGHLRLVIREVEELVPSVSATGVSAATELSQRTVYVDTVDLPVAGAS